MLKKMFLFFILMIITVNHSFSLAPIFRRIQRIPQQSGIQLAPEIEFTQEVESFLNQSASERASQRFSNFIGPKFSQFLNSIFAVFYNR